MLTANGVTHGIFFTVTIVDTGVDACAVDSSLHRIAAVDVCGACVASACSVGALIQTHDEVVAQFVVMEHGVDGAGEHGVVIVQLVIKAQ